MIKTLSIVLLAATCQAADVVLGIGAPTFTGSGNVRIASWGYHPPPYSPVSDFHFTTNAGAIWIDGYVGAGGTCNIPPTINGYPVTIVAGDAFNYPYGPFVTAGSLAITRIIIPSGVTDIGAGGCARLSGMVTVEIPATMATIYDVGFYGCTVLTKAYFHGNAPSIGGNVFLASDNAVIYRRADATGWPTVPETFSGRPTAIWTSYPNPMP